MSAHLSLRELARRIDVSPSLLSQIERGLAQPSVATLWSLVAALDVSLDSLFVADPSADPQAYGTGSARVLRASERPAIDLEGSVRWERLTPTPDPDVDFAFVTYEASSTFDRRPTAVHSGREYGYLICGELLIEVGGTEITLGPGDSVVLESAVPHRFRATGDVPALAVWWNLRSPR